MEELPDKIIIYSIINIYIELDIDPGLSWNNFKCVLPNKEIINEETYKVRVLKTPTEIHGLECYNISKFYNIMVRKGCDIMLVDHAWKNALIFPVYEKSNMNSLLCQFFYAKAIQKRILYFHSSLISYKALGLMFLGPSGVGKTTQAELWSKYCEAQIVNGDVSFVEEKNGNFFGWGTPWHGSSPYCENMNVPISALIVLKKGKVTSIRELMGFEKVTSVSSNVIYPQWVENGMEICIKLLDHLLNALPVYELSCRPDKEAVDIVRKTIFDKFNIK